LGAEAAEFATQHLHKYVSQLISEQKMRTDDVLRAAFIKTDEAFAEYASTNECEAGAVGVFVYYEYNLDSHGNEENVIYVANVGDCRAILCHNGQCNVLTVDHNPKNKEEQKRCGDCIKGDVLSDRINVTRAIGDYVGGIHGKLEGLTAEPHVLKHKLSKQDEFLIIACDGLWDVISNEIAMKHCRQSLRKHNDVEQAAKDLIDLAQKTSVRKCYGQNEAKTADNISVMVVGFKDQKGTIVPKITDSFLKRPPRRFIGHGFKKKTTYSD